MMVKTQKVRFDAVCIGKEWSRLTDSNRRPTDYKGITLFERGRQKHEFSFFTAQLLPKFPNFKR